jgi:signal transduction histidine kinase
MIEFFSARNKRMLKSPHFWVIVAIILFLIFIYQFWPWREWRFAYSWHWLRWLSFLRNLVVFEFSCRFVGSLFLIPIIYATLAFHWRGTLIATLLSLIGFFPVVAGLWHNLDSWLTNISLFLLPICLVLVIAFEIELRRRNREYYAELERERRIYLLKILEAQEKERQRLAQELHDESIQTLLATASYAEALESTNDDNIIELRRKAGWIKDTIRKTVEELRRMSLDLRPGVLDNLGLVPALRWIAEQTKREDHIRSQITVDGLSRNLSPQIEVTVFRVVQEALNNIKRHAKASEAVVKLQFCDESIRISIQDDGQGFLVPQKLTGFATKGKLGLIGIQQRIKSLGGTFEIRSEVGEGTLLSIEIPS